MNCRHYSAEEKQRLLISWCLGAERKESYKLLLLYSQHTVNLDGNTTYIVNANGSTAVYEVMVLPHMFLFPISVLFAAYCLLFSFQGSCRVYRSAYRWHVLFSIYNYLLSSMPTVLIAWYVLMLFVLLLKDTEQPALGFADIVQQLL